VKFVPANLQLSPTLAPSAGLLLGYGNHWAMRGFRRFDA